MESFLPPYIAQIVDGRLAPEIQPAVEAVTRCGGTRGVLRMPFPIATEHVGQGRLGGWLVVHPPIDQIPLGQL